MTARRSPGPTVSKGWTGAAHTCWRLSTETTCFDCLRPMVDEPLDLLPDMAPSFDQDSYYDGRDL